MFINSTAGRALYVDEKLPASSSRRRHPVPEQTPLARGTVLASCKDQNENCFFSGLLSVLLGTVLLGVLLEEYHGINRAKNILSFSKNKSGRSSESLQLVGFWLWAADGVVLFMLVPVICYSLCCSLAAESVHKALTAQDGPAGPSGMLCPQEAVSFDILLANVVLWGATQTVFQDYFPSLLNPKISYLGCLTCIMVFHREVGIFFVTKGCATRSSGQFEASIRNNARREKWKKHLFAWGWTEDPHLGLHLQSLSYH